MSAKQNRDNLLKKAACIIGVAGASIIIGFPLQAQQSGGGGALNPSPSIFNEPPYNRRGTGATTPTPDTTSPSTTPPATTPDTTSPSTTPPATTPDTTTPTPDATTPPPAGGASSGSGTENVVALAAANGSFKTLTAALKAADLTTTLEGTGPFTVFAPTDAAFAALPQEALQELLKPENKALLAKILTYHVVPGNVASTDLKSGTVKTVEGGAINVKVDPATGVTVNEAKVVQPDIKASNGVIHVIDKVILPPDI
ncbi:fasciclin domain-containing protein [Aliterella atlantica]|uniref:Beta-Ig-H3/fasciclin n=1 Tax=Aliterella atlantica CENA595 TaxID=1618023 RepID=A0A0D8ZT15_9CYAN|nr:fasciclin domain-containing protein [Aliterella atlantica]KJH71903.1 beta-Ig-H3/fasciclin [Aliterella atlantica CENA595]